MANQVSQSSIQVQNTDQSVQEDFNAFTAYFRSIDITKYLGGNRYGDPNGKGQHLQILTLFAIFNVFSIVFWILYFGLNKYYNSKKWRPLLTTPKKAKKMVNYTISSMHAVFSVFCFFECVFFSCNIPGKTFFTEYECFDYTSPMMEFLMTISLSYFIQDAISLKSIFGTGKVTNVTYFHHGICIGVIISCLLIGRAIGITVYVLFATEISTICVNNRFMMKETGVSDTKKWWLCWNINGWALLTTFFTSRVIFLGYFLIAHILPYLFNYDEDEAFASIGGVKYRWMQFLLIIYVMIYLLNIYWFYGIAKGAYKYKKSERKQVELAIKNEIEDKC